VVPYQPFVEALRPCVRTASTAALRSTVPLGLAELGRILPELAVSFPSGDALRSDPDAERFRLLEAVNGVLELVAGARGVLLVIDDLHWAGKPTLVMLQHVLRRGSTRPVQVVATYRDTELTPTHPLADTLASLRRDDVVVRVALHGFDEQGVEALLHAWAGHDPPPEFSHAVYE